MGRPLRRVIEVRWSRSERCWYVRNRDVSGSYLYAASKRESVLIGRAEARALAAAGGKVELIVYRKDGAIGKGRDSRSTYGADPRRRQG